MQDGFVRVRIKWLTFEQGGRKQAPIIVDSWDHYAGTVSFDMQTNNDGSPLSLWSNFIKNYDNVNRETLEHEADMTLMVKEMRSTKLLPGAKFNCYEGSRLVARGEVLDESRKAS